MFRPMRLPAARVVSAVPRGSRPDALPMLFGRSSLGRRFAGAMPPPDKPEGAGEAAGRPKPGEEGLIGTAAAAAAAKQPPDGEAKLEGDGLGKQAVKGVGGRIGEVVGQAVSSAVAGRAGAAAGAVVGAVAGPV